MPAPPPSRRAANRARARTMVWAQRGHPRRRTARAMPWAVPAIVKMPTINSVPDQENAGSEVIRRIQSLAAAPSRAPPIRNAADQARRGSSGRARTLMVCPPHRRRHCRPHESCPSVVRCSCTYRTDEPDAAAGDRLPQKPRRRLSPGGRRRSSVVVCIGTFDRGEPHLSRSGGGDDGSAPRRGARGVVWSAGVAGGRGPDRGRAGRPPVDDDRRPAGRRAVRRRGHLARPPRPALRRRSQRRRGPRAGGVHPPRPQRPPASRTRPGRRLPALDRAQPGPRPEPPGSRLAAPPPPVRRHRPGHRGRDRRPRGPARGARRAARPPGPPAACLVLRYYDELGPDEIAATLGISRNSVKTHLQRGLAALEARLAERAAP